MGRLIILLFLGQSLMASAQLKTENIFLITLDGLRWQELYTGADVGLVADRNFVQNPESLKAAYWRDDPIERRSILMPFFWSVIANEGQLYGNRLHDNRVNVSNRKWFSYPGYNEILVGYSDDARITSNAKIDNPNKTVLEFIGNQKGFESKVAVFGSWDVFPFIVNEKRSGIPVNAGFRTAGGEALSEMEKTLNLLQPEIPSPWAAVRLDAFTHHYAMEYLKKKRPRLLYIAYGETDDFAHDGEYDQYLHSANRTDQFIGELWDWVQNDPDYQGKTTFIITTDHGRGTRPLEAWKHHGIRIRESDEAWIAVLGPDTPGMGEVKAAAQLYLNQIANTMASLLGLNYVNEKPVGPMIKTVVN